MNIPRHAFGRRCAVRDDVELVGSHRGDLVGVFEEHVPVVAPPAGDVRACPGSAQGVEPRRYGLSRSDCPDPAAVPVDGEAERVANVVFTRGEPHTRGLGGTSGSEISWPARLRNSSRAARAAGVLRRLRSGSTSSRHRSFQYVSTGRMRALAARVACSASPIRRASSASSVLDRSRSGAPQTNSAGSSSAITGRSRAWGRLRRG